MEMKDFIERYAIERKHTNSVKWDALEERYGDADLFPLWIEDMDFRVPEGITEALNERIQHGAYGYTFLSDEYFERYQQWMQTYFQFEVKREWLRFTTSVVQSMYHAINAFTQKNDSILILSPVYYPFFASIADTQRQLVDVGLRNENGRFSLDYDAIEAAIVREKVRLYIHCSPHNPIGRVWTHDEQARLFEICERHDVLIISDEIHQDFVYEGHTHIPSATVQQGKYRHRLITFNSATKTFNLAALMHSTVIICDEKLRAQYDAYITRIGHTEANIMGALATSAGYAYGREWLDAVKKVIQFNYNLLHDQLKRTFPEITIYPLEGTYLAFIDLNPVLKGACCHEWIQTQCGLAVGYGETFGEKYTGYIRINLATSPQNIEFAIQKLTAMKERL
ncbi:MAG: MalY/PatB family protein [Aerococcaceae bacterium]|nr:MalY/PatB family protein [Aerococcaceae bacterium]